MSNKKVPKLNIEQLPNQYLHKYIKVIPSKPKGKDNLYTKPNNRWKYTPIVKSTTINPKKRSFGPNSYSKIPKQRLQIISNPKPHSYLPSTTQNHHPNINSHPPNTQKHIFQFYEILKTCKTDLPTTHPRSKSTTKTTLLPSFPLPSRNHHQKRFSNLNSKITEIVQKQNSLTSEKGLNEDNILYDSQGDPRWLKFLRQYSTEQEYSPEQMRYKRKFDYMLCKAKYQHNSFG